jgi:hypothetical protein
MQTTTLVLDFGETEAILEAEGYLKATIKR